MIALTACGDSVPGNAVATVDGKAITRTEFAHWLNIAELQSASQGAPKVSYSPPDFASCVASKRKSAPKPAKGQPSQTDAQFKTLCKQEYVSLRDQAMQFLILEQWINGEAKDQGVTLSNAEFNKQYTAAKKQSFPTEKDFQTFIKQSGYTVSDTKRQVHWNALYTDLQKKAVAKAAKVTDKSIAAFYNKNKSQPPFSTPATRDLRVVLTKTEAKANQAKQALQSGQSWKVVAKKYSIDQASKNQGGSLLGIAQGTQEKTFDTAIFAATKNKLTGPVKTQFGYYVFEVRKIVPATHESLKQATPTIKPQLLATNQQKADTDFNNALLKKWKAKTNCADQFAMAQCKNAPKVSTTTTAAPASGGTVTPTPTPTG
jgi:foldase protein PrsA